MAWWIQEFAQVRLHEQQITVLMCDVYEITRLRERHIAKPKRAEILPS